MKYQASNWTTWESVFYYRKKKEIILYPHRSH